MNKNIDNKLEKYLAKLDVYLACMPILYKIDILSELKRDFYERLNNSESADEIISKWGSPKDLAISYMGNGLISKQKFSFKKLMHILLFYSYASFLYLLIIPSLSISSFSFLLSALLLFFIGIVEMLNIPLIDVINIDFMGYKLTGINAFFYTFVIAIILIILAILCIKLILIFINLYKNTKKGFKIL